MLVTVSLPPRWLKGKNIANAGVGLRGNGTGLLAVTEDYRRQIGVNLNENLEFRALNSSFPMSLLVIHTDTFQISGQMLK